MKLNKKKGFTIVELVIVIAVIAILAAVLIPNISKLVKKANQSADESLVRNLNTALSIDAEKHTTMSAALKAALDNGGYDVAKIVAKNDGAKILWDSLNDCFVYMKKGADKPTYLPNTKTVADVKDWNFFEILEEMPTDMSKQKYSIYLAGSGKTVEAATVSVGFDAGENTVKNLTYKNDSATAQDVIIRTNGGTLTVNAPKDVVRHFGASDYTDIVSVDNNSYHENGVSAYVRIENGHFYAEANAKVLNLYVAKSGVTLTANTGAKVVAYSKSADVTEVTVNGAKVNAEDTNDTDFSAKKDNSAVVAENGVAEINGIQFATLQAAFDAANDNDVIVVKSDIDLTLTVSLTKNVAVTLDMNGKTITNTVDLWDNPDEASANWSLISVRNGKLTITGNGSFRAKANDCFAVDVQDGAECVVENGTFVGNCDAIYVSKGKLTVNGGSFSIQQLSMAGKEYEFVLNCLDENRENGMATIVVTGGTFQSFDPSNCQAEGAGTNFLADGYKVECSEKVESGKTYKYYTVVKADN